MIYKKGKEVNNHIIMWLAWPLRFFISIFLNRKTLILMVNSSMVDSVSSGVWFYVVITELLYLFSSDYRLFYVELWFQFEERAVPRPWAFSKEVSVELGLSNVCWICFYMSRCDCVSNFNFIVYICVRFSLQLGFFLRN